MSHLHIAPTYDLFISYAAADRAWVDGFLIDALEQARITYHREDAFVLGVPRLIEFERAIQSSTRTLLVISPAYLTDTFAQFVDVLVNSYGMETATWPVIPLILQSVDALPPRLRQLVRIDATSPDDQQNALSKLCAELQRPMPGPALLPECPYPGMMPFDEATSDRFFGREHETHALVDRLRLHPFLAVIGASGSGKSSLVRAGLIPALRKSRLFGAGDWSPLIMRPGVTPGATLAARLGDQPRDVAPRTSRTLLIVDQFEELFTLAAGETEAFQHALLDLAARPDCFVVLTVRADFYADLMATPLWSEIQAHRVEVTPLGTAALRRAIVQPAAAVGVAIEGALIERLVADAAGEPGVLPFIQETLVLLWERLERRYLPMRSYEALVLSRSAYGGDSTGISGLQVAIARRADATLANLTAAQQVTVRRIFLRLIQFGEGRADTRRQQPLASLHSAGDDPAVLHETLQRLAGSRLITLSGDDLSPDTGRSTSVRVDIAHEALIRGWPTLQTWIAARREAEQIRRRLEDKAHEWVRLGRGEGGLLDPIELAEAERWLASSDAEDLGYDSALPELARFSRAMIEQGQYEREAVRQRELAQAQSLVAEQQRRFALQRNTATRLIRLRARLLVGFTVVSLLIFTASFYLLYTAATRWIENQIHTTILQTLEGAAAGIDGDQFVALYREAKPRPDGYTDDPRYWQHVAQLAAIQRIQQQASVYTYIRGDRPDEVIYIGDNSALNVPPSGVQFREIHHIDSPASSGMLAGLSHAVLQDQVYQDKDGVWLGGYTPLKNAHGAIVGAIGIDFRSDQISYIRAIMQRAFWIAFGIGCVMMLMVAWLVASLFKRQIVMLMDVGTH